MGKSSTGIKEKLSHQKNGKLYIRSIIQGIAMLGFLFLVLQGSLQLWIILLGVGALAGIFVGRLYCGWICPMGTIMRMESWIYKKLGIQRKNPAMKNGNNGYKGSVRWIQAVLFLVFFGGMIASRRFGVRVNLIIYLVLLAVVISLFFKEEVWHRICPHGIAMSVTAKVEKFKKRKMIIEKDACIGCGKCQEVCLNMAVITEVENIRSIVTKDCLTCFECQKVCPTKAIVYQ